MNWRHVSWALDQSPGTASEKMTLVFLADVADPITGIARINYTRLAALSCQSERSVYRAVGGLQERGYIRRCDEEVKYRKDGLRYFQLREDCWR